MLHTLVSAASTVPIDVVAGPALPVGMASPPPSL
jgi:hypothetical protein